MQAEEGSSSHRKRKHEGDATADSEEENLTTMLITDFYHFGADEVLYHLKDVTADMVIKAFRDGRMNESAALLHVVVCVPEYPETTSQRKVTFVSQYVKEEIARVLKIELPSSIMQL